MTKIRILKIIVVIIALLLAALAGFAVARAEGEPPPPPPQMSPLALPISPIDVAGGGNTSAVTLSSMGPESPSVGWLVAVALVAIVVAAVIAWLSSRNNESW